MKHTEQYYAELIQLKKKEEKIPSQKKLSVPQDAEAIRVSSHRVRIRLEEDWLSMAETAIPAFRKAISQDRKRLQNEIYRERIELVRKTSSVSVRELSKHSETLQQGPGGILPESLYVPRNDEDYHIYDNRFLYTALILLRNFMETVMSKVNGANRGRDRLSFRLCYGTDGDAVQLQGEYSADGAFLDGQQGDLCFQRVEALREETEDLLHTPLMSQFNEKDLLDLPIQPTNVIRMDPNFICVNELLDFLVSYKKEGYVRIETDFEQKPATEACPGELAAVLPLISAICEAETGGIDREALLHPSGKKDLLSDPELLGEILSHEELKAYSEQLEQMYLEKELLYEESLKKQTEELLRSREHAFDEERRELESRMTALKLQCGLEGEEDYQTEEAFLRLEQQKDAFDRFYTEQLSRMKREARKKYVWDVLFPKKDRTKASDSPKK